MIHSCCQRDQVISYDKPQMQAVLEVRPRIRQAATPPAPALTPPVMMTAVELKPLTWNATAPAPPSTDPKPQEIAAFELRPVMKKAEKE
jgi:hypothetical protein